MTERHSHAARPTDLVALVTFDDQVRRNQAITLDGLADPEEHKTHPLSVALAQWLHLGRRMWINVDGREVRGIATARDLNARTAWVIDTLIDAAGEDAADDVLHDEVLQDLLSQATEAAVGAGVTHLLLRTELDAPAREAAQHAGFRPALVERLWTGTPGAIEPPSDVTVRPLTDADQQAAFQLYCRAIPSEARALLGMTRDEWAAVRDPRWARGGDELVAVRGGTIRATAAIQHQHERAQVELLSEPGDVDATRALLAAIVAEVGSTELRLLVPRAAGAIEQALSDAGLEPVGEYIQLCRRTARPVLAEAPAHAGLPIPTGGGA